MKSLLISLMAFLCALGVYAAPTGTGTEEDPYVIADGDTYVIPGGATVYSSFTAPSKGTLKLQQSGWSFFGFMGNPDFTVAFNIDPVFFLLSQ